MMINRGGSGDGGGGLKGGGVGGIMGMDQF